MKTQWLACIILMLSACGVAKHQPIKVEIVHNDQGYQLLRGGQPYPIRGAGLSGGDMRALVAHGGNSIRTWNTENAGEILDEAQARGLTVMLCIAMGAEHWGFDYDDEAAVARQLDFVRQEVLKYRDHPALLGWILGNELNFDYTNPRVFDAINEASRVVHELDPNHPTTTTIAGIDERVYTELVTRAPDLDFISLQEYGGLFVLPERLKKIGLTGPIMVTEWGALGHWEVASTEWGAPIEPNSSQKAETYAKAYAAGLIPIEQQLLGSYVFLWGQKQERTPTWYGLFTRDGMETAAIDVVSHFWTGSWPNDRAPSVEAMTLNGLSAESNIRLTEGEMVEVQVVATDDRATLNYRWEVKPESNESGSGGAIEKDISSIDGLIEPLDAGMARLRVPAAGAYRLFVTILDGAGNAAHANIPFFVTARDEIASVAQEFLAGEVMAVAYSGFRDGQHPDRGDGAVNPTEAQVLEDLQLLVKHKFRLIRLYDSGENSAMTLRLIRDNELPIKVLLGAWLSAEESNHERCPWLDEPIPATKLVTNRRENDAEIKRLIELTRAFPDQVIAVNVGNEALVEWTDHLVPLDRVIELVQRVQDAVSVPVTVAENYAWWANSGETLAQQVDFLGVHTYPQWEEKTIGQALDYTIENIDSVREMADDKPLAILEAGWATTASEFGARASEAKQQRYFHELEDWARSNRVTVFFFEAFDENWKGDPANLLGAEKHWGLFKANRQPKKMIRSGR